jgi:hypothetical protein
MGGFHGRRHRKGDPAKFIGVHVGVDRIGRSAACSPPALVNAGPPRYISRVAGQAPSSAGEVAEWLKAPHSKCGIRVTVSGVRIPPSPPHCTERTGLFPKSAIMPWPVPIACLALAQSWPVAAFSIGRAGGGVPVKAWPPNRPISGAAGPCWPHPDRAPATIPPACQVPSMQPLVIGRKAGLIDGRSVIARRYRDICSATVADQGGARINSAALGPLVATSRSISSDTSITSCDNWVMRA